MVDLGFVLSVCLMGVSLVAILGERVFVPLEVALRSYKAWLDAELRFLHSRVRAQRVIVAQGVVVVAGCLMARADWRALSIVAVGLLGTYPFFKIQRRKRIERAEAQAEPLLGALKRALAAAPSVGEAVASAQRVVDAPLKEELRVVLEEFHLGTPLEVALEHMVDRLGGPNLRAAILTLTLGHRGGGRLEVAIETTAAALREMERLEGVLRTKTAEGKAQTAVISVIPFFLMYAVQWASPGYLQPLLESTKGSLLLAVAAVLWLGALLSMRKILAVDL